MNFITNLLAKDDSGADIIGFCGVIALLVLCGISVYAVVTSPGSWNPITFAAAVTAHLGAISGGKTVRDRFSTAPSATSSSVVHTAEGSVTVEATKAEGA